MDYLINNGYEQYSDKLQKGFIHRRENDSLNNAEITETLMIYTKKKRDMGDVTIDNILDERGANILNAIEQLVHKGRDIVGTKRALGTLFAEKYSDNKIIKGKMLELISNPEYTLQMLINESIALEKTKNQEEKEADRD